MLTDEEDFAICKTTSSSLKVNKFQMEKDFQVSLQNFVFLGKGNTFVRDG